MLKYLNPQLYATGTSNNLPNNYPDEQHREFCNSDTSPYLMESTCGDLVNIESDSFLLYVTEQISIRQGKLIGF